ncbi:hypothetical protein CSC14_4314 [Proteus mirabilis]|nr:hypothetical protein CSC14_4314 [Proteus mirabilis]
MSGNPPKPIKTPKSDLPIKGRAFKYSRTPSALLSRERSEPYKHRI